MIGIYEDSPTFVTNVEFSGVDGNTLRNNAIFLDAFTQQPIPIFNDGLYFNCVTGFSKGGSWANAQPFFWRGAFQYRTGMNIANYLITGTPVTNERLRIYHRKATDPAPSDLNAPGTLVADIVFPTSSGVGINISGAGYSDGDIIETSCQTYFPGPTFPKNGYYYMMNAYTSFASGLDSGAYPGVPSFGSLSAANLNQLGNAQDWVMDRLSHIPRVPFMAGMFVVGTHKSTGINPYPLWLGMMTKANGQNTFHAIIDYYSYNGEEGIQILVNGVLKYDSAKISNTQYGTLDITFDVSALSDNTAYLVVVQQYVTPGLGQAELQLYGKNNIIPSRFTIRTLEVTANRSYYTPSAEFGSLESMTFSTLQGRLNNFASGTTTAYNRVNTNTLLFNVARMFRRKLGVDGHQVNSLDPQNLPTLTRIGERYVVAGKDVKIAWGGYTLKKALTEPAPNRDVYEFAIVENLTGSDKVEVKEGYFAELEKKGLYVGTQYYLLGEEISFFSEYLR